MNYLVGRSVEPSRKKDSRREGGGGGSGGCGKGRRTTGKKDTEREAEVEGSRVREERCGEGGGIGGSKERNYRKPLGGHPLRFEILEFSFAKNFRGDPFRSIIFSI